MKGSGGHLVGPESLWMSLNHAPTNIPFFFLLCVQSVSVLFFSFSSSFSFSQNCEGCSQAFLGATQDEAVIVKKWTKRVRKLFGVQWLAMASVACSLEVGS